MKKMFLLQEKLEELMTAKKVKLSGQTLTMVPSEDEYDLKPAVKFLACETSESDPHDLVGRVAMYDKLIQEGAEIFLSSIIYKEQSYKVEQGYICSLSSME